MTDVLPRLDGAFDGSDKRALDRRQLIKAGAWAAPVLLLATATPAAAAVSAPTPLTPSQPPGAVAPAGAGTGFIPAYLVGATGITGKPYWNGYTNGNPKLLGAEINITGIPNAKDPRTVTAYYYVPTAAAPLNAPNPADWVWKIESNNFKTASTSYQKISATTGLWMITLILPSWGTGGYAHVYVTLP